MSQGASVTLLARISLPLLLVFTSAAVAQQPATRQSRGPWETSVLEQIKASEYDLTFQPTSVIAGERGGWHATNRSQGLRAYFRLDGISIVPRTEKAPDWEIRLEPMVQGRSEGPLEADASRVRFRHGHRLEEYGNDPSGITLTLKGSMLDRSGDTVASYRIDTTLEPIASADGRSIGFYRGGTRVARVDLTRESIADVGASGRLVMSEKTLRIMSDEADSSIDPGAGYTVSLLLTGSPAGLATSPVSPTPDWTVESDQAGALMGSYVAPAGDVNGDGYDDIMVAALLYDNGQTNEGRAYLFLGSPTGPSTTPAWTAEGNQTSARFGWSVDSAGDVNGDGYDDIAVSADLYDHTYTDEGAAFVYLGSASGPSATPAWSGYGGQSGVRYGHSVATVGDVNGDGYDDFSVSSIWYSNGQTSEGRAFIYAGSASGLPATATWTFEPNQSGAQVNLVRGAGDVNGDGYADVMVGADNYDNGQINEGRAYLLLGSAAGLNATPVWMAEGDQSYAQFGFCVGTAGDVNGDGYDDVIVFSDVYDNGQSSEGAAFVWYGGPGSLILSGTPGTPSNAQWKVEGDQSGSLLRWGGTAGDVNGDGYDDVVVGLQYYSTMFSQEGRAMVFLGSPGGLETTPAWIANGGQAGAGFGALVSTAGDVNGDGFSDILVGAYYYDNGQTDEGRAYLFLGQSTACVPSDEVCDGVDNDCDGTIDEGFDVGAPCSAGTGACETDGVMVCDPSGAFTVCNATPGSPSPETCDQIDNDCNGVVDDGAVLVSASSVISPTTLNVNSQGSAFTVNVALTNTCDPSNPVPIDGHLLDRAWISRAAGFSLPDPASIPCPMSDGDTLFERGIVDDILARVVTNKDVSLKFDRAADGSCYSLDGDRQDLLGLLSSIPDGSSAQVCVTSMVYGMSFETCAAATVKNHGNR